MKTPSSLSFRQRLGRAARLSLAALILLGTADLLGTVCRRFVRVNLSPSLPRGLYRPVPLPLARGRLVSACLPPTIARLGRARSYLPPGPCPGDSAPVLKILAAIPGDRVEITHSGVLVNGARLRKSGAHSADSHGRSLSPIPPGRYRLRRCYWLAAPHPDSWDSRYFGCLPRESLREVLVPWWTPSPPPPLHDFRAKKSRSMNTTPWPTKEARPTGAIERPTRYGRQEWTTGRCLPPSLPPDGARAASGRRSATVEGAVRADW
jgi:conjugative transfer signal peptidase TraF